MRVRPIQPNDVPEIIALWNRNLPDDPIDADRYWRTVLLDPNFDRELTLVVDGEEGVQGYAHAIRRRVGYGPLGLQDGQGWITAFFVDQAARRRGYGRALLMEALGRLKARGVHTASCNGYAPYYQFPGVDHRCGEARALLDSLGFTPAVEAVAMELDLTTPLPTFGASTDVVVRDLELQDTIPLLEFVQRKFDYWLPSIQESLREDGGEVTIVEMEGRIVGFAQWENSHTDPPHGAPGRFGPFGVDPDLRGVGIGAALFRHVAVTHAARGAKRLWFGWAGGRNLSFYERFGCRTTRRYTLYRRSLEDFSSD